MVCHSDQSLHRDVIGIVICIAITHAIHAATQIASNLVISAIRMSQTELSIIQSWNNINAQTIWTHDAVQSTPNCFLASWLAQSVRAEMAIQAHWIHFSMPCLRAIGKKIEGKRKNIRVGLVTREETIVTTAVDRDAFTRIATLRTIGGTKGNRLAIRRVLEDTIGTERKGIGTRPFHLLLLSPPVEQIQQQVAQCS